MALKVQLSASLIALQTSSPDGGSGRVEQTVSKFAELLNGTTDAKADLAFIDTRTLASNTSEDLDLYGTLLNAYGGVLNMAEIVAILIISDPANTTNLTIGGATNEALLWFAAAGDKEVVKKGGVSLHYDPAGWAITADTADDFKIANASGAANTFYIGIIGRSA